MKLMMKATYKLGICYSFWELVHNHHGRAHVGKKQTGMVLKKQLRTHIWCTSFRQRERISLGLPRNFETPKPSHSHTSPPISLYPSSFPNSSTNRGLDIQIYELIEALLIQTTTVLKLSQHVLNGHLFNPTPLDETSQWVWLVGSVQRNSALFGHL